MNVIVTVELGGMTAGLTKGIVDTLLEFPVQIIVLPIVTVWRRKVLSLPV